jgi:hypothetical protein
MVMTMRFSSPVSRSSTAENCPVTPIAARDRVGLAGDVMARDVRVTGVGGDEGREDLDCRRLADGVGAEQGEDRALDDVRVDAVEDGLVAEGLPEPDGREPLLCRVHAPGPAHVQDRDR